MLDILFSVLKQHRKLICHLRASLYVGGAYFVVVAKEDIIGFLSFLSWLASGPEK